tara:strand:- start:1979 stop:2155 length:177 start_codon:yes stop_codon:yes gene_type:complete
VSQGNAHISHGATGQLGHVAHGNGMDGAQVVQYRTALPDFYFTVTGAPLADQRFMDAK